MGAQELHERSKAMKQMHVDRHGPSDLAPLMVVAFDDMTTYLGTVQKGMIKALEAGTRMGDIVAASITRLRAANDNKPLRRAMLVVEGYTQFNDLANPSPLPEHGDLAAAFANDPASTVSEALITNVWAYDGDKIVFESKMSCFHYTDGGLLVWDKDEEGEMEGHICDQGRKVMR